MLSNHYDESKGFNLVELLNTTVLGGFEQLPSVESEMLSVWYY
jgi:hypothetical protein